MTGLSEGDFDLISKRSSRLINEFPDGIPRTITLRSWDWELFDRLQRNKGWFKDDLAKAAYQLTTEFCIDPANFESHLRRSFSRFIGLNAGLCMDMKEVNSN